MSWISDVVTALRLTGQVAVQGRFWLSILRALLGPALLLLIAVLILVLYVNTGIMSIIAGGSGLANVATAVALLVCVCVTAPLLLRSWCPPVARAVVAAMQVDLPELPLPSLGRFVAAWVLVAFVGLLLAVLTFFIPRPFSWIMFLPLALLASGYQVRCALCIHADAGERAAVTGNTTLRRALLWFPLCGLPLYVYEQGKTWVKALIISPYDFTATTTSRLVDVLGMAASLAVFVVVLVMWAAFSLQALAERRGHAALGGRRTGRDAPQSPVIVAPREPLARRAPLRTVPSNPAPVGKWILVGVAALAGVTAVAYAARQPLTHRYLLWTDPDYAQEAQYNTGKTSGEALATALKEAGCNGKLARIKLLMRIGVGTTPDSLGPALVCAAKAARTDIALFLIDKKANVNAMPIEAGADPRLPATALQYAVAGKNQVLADLLISKGADVSLQAPGAPAAVHFAAAGMDTSMIAMLIGAGARPDASTPKAPIFYFVEAAATSTSADRSAAGWAAVITRAERAGLSTSGQGGDGGNLLHWAAGRGELGLVDVLLARGLDRHRQDKRGAMPYMLLANWYRYASAEPGPELEFMLKALTSGLSDLNGAAVIETPRGMEEGWTLARAAAARPRVRAVFGERISYATLGGTTKEQQWPLTDREHATELVAGLSATQLAGAPSLALALRAKGWEDLAIQAEGKR
jgi:ankyrin repeat protein